jgi:hypothetical protein
MFRYSLRTQLIVLALGPMIVAAVISGLWSSRVFAPRLRVENYPRLQIGMAKATVESLLGGPSGNYGRYDHKKSFRTDEGYRIPPGSVELWWFDDANRFELYFDAQSRLVGYHKRATYRQSP